MRKMHELEGLLEYLGSSEARVLREKGAKYYWMISEARKKLKEAKAREEARKEAVRQRREEREKFLAMYMGGYQPTTSADSAPAVPAPNAPQRGIDQASREFWEWATGKGQREEEPLPVVHWSRKGKRHFRGT